MTNPNVIGDSQYIAKKRGWALAAVRAYPAGDRGDVGTTISDLIGDLLHLANDHGIQGGDMVKTAMHHFTCEGGDGETPDDIAMCMSEDGR